MRVAVVGGGPGGLFFATLLRRADPSIEVTVFERNRADDTFGFGVVFSDRTLAGIHDADPVLRQALTEHGRHWDEIEVRLKGERIRCGGNGMAVDRAHDVAGADAGPRPRRRGGAAVLHRGHAWPTSTATTSWSPRTAAARRIREQLDGDLGVEVDTATAKFIWFGTDYLFDGLTFVHERSPDGVFAVHGYPISDRVSHVHRGDRRGVLAPRRARRVRRRPSRRASATWSRRTTWRSCSPTRSTGKRLLTNNSRWGNFRTRRTRRWHSLAPRPVALLGDAVHTAHFSVGSGTKMAMEDAVALARALAASPDDLGAALAAYEAGRAAVGPQDPGLRPAEPGLVGALRALPRRVRAVAVRLPLPVAQHLRRAPGPARPGVRRGQPPRLGRRPRRGAAGDARSRTADGRRRVGW